MLAGIALLGVVTASFASWLLDKVREVEAESQAATHGDVQALAGQVESLRNDLIRQLSTPRSDEGARSQSADGVTRSSPSSEPA
jgi:hypothetical protein